jgi:hypothetical protein
MKAVITDKNKIRNVFDGSPECIFVQPTDNIIDVPYGFRGQEGEDIRCWDSEWELIPAEEMISEGYRVLLPVEKIVDHKIVRKTLQEQYDEGIYIPEEGWIVFDNKLFKLDEIEKYRNERYTVILDAFNNEMGTSHFMSTAIGIEIDCRRSATKNDLQNVESLYKKMVKESIATVNYIGYSEIKTGVTQSKINDMSYEMIDYANSLYTKKWLKEETIRTAKTIQEIESIIW